MHLTDATSALGDARCNSGCSLLLKRHIHKKDIGGYMRNEASSPQTFSLCNMAEPGSEMSSCHHPELDDGGGHATDRPQKKKGGGSRLREELRVGRI